MTCGNHARQQELDELRATLREALFEAQKRSAVSTFARPIWLDRDLKTRIERAYP